MLLQLHHLSMHGIKLLEIDRECLSSVVEIFWRFRIHAANVVVLRMCEVVFHQVRESLERQLVDGLDPWDDCNVARGIKPRRRHFVLLVD